MNAESVSGAVGDIAFELMQAHHRGLEWEMDVQTTQNPDGTFNDGRVIRITVKPSVAATKPLIP